MSRTGTRRDFSRPKSAHAHDQQGSGALSGAIWRPAGDEHVSEGHDPGARARLPDAGSARVSAARRHSPTFIRWFFGLTTWGTPRRSIFTISPTDRKKSRTSITCPAGQNSISGAIATRFSATSPTRCTS